MGGDTAAMRATERAWPTYLQWGPSQMGGDTRFGRDGKTRSMRAFNGAPPKWEGTPKSPSSIASGCVSAFNGAPPKWEGTPELEAPVTPRDGSKPSMGPLPN